MATTIQSIDVGTRGNDGSGDTIREAFKKVNSNFSLLSSAILGGDTLKFANLSDFGNKTTNPYSSNQLLMSNNSGNSISCRNIIAGAGVTIDVSSDNNILISANSLANLYTDQITESGGKYYFSNELAWNAFTAGYGILPIELTVGTIAVDSNVVASISSLDSEISRATAAELAITNSITTISDAISSETTRAQSAESSLATAISNEASLRTTSINNEITRAQSAESSLATAISNEASSRTSSINSEITRAQAAEASLTTAISNEASSRTTSINNEITRAQSAESSLASRITALEPSPSALVDSTTGPITFTNANLPTVLSINDTHGSARVYNLPLIAGRSVIIHSTSSDNINLKYSGIDILNTVMTSAIIACDGTTWFSVYQL